MLVEFEQNRMARTIQNFELFDKKMVNNLWQSVDAILEDFSVTETIIWCETINLRLSSFNVPKLWKGEMCNRVKSWTKHGRPNQS